jgi:SpoVK/Ycf46/Vps4 family AAA+-type ATPase
VQTLLVEKLAAESGLVLLCASPSTILSKWAGDSEKAVRRLFELARTMQPCLLFLV